MVTKSKRLTLSKKLRFEIFKRDSFKCGYCGKTAPDVILHLDHIKPIAKGGDNHPLNLITACHDCNMGKSAVPLDDGTALLKQKAQLDTLQEKREQQEMMFKWHEGLRDMDLGLTQKIASFWEERCTGFRFSKAGLAGIPKWLKQYSIDDILTAMEASISSYIEYNQDGTCTKESWIKAVDMIPRICSVRKAQRTDPELSEMLKLRAFFAKTSPWFKPSQNTWVLNLIKSARKGGISMDRLYDMCRMSSGVLALDKAIEEELANG